ncbi:HNH endonuclease [Micromonospora chalcea]|uniref:HNH endonuclease n=1 Tax=Micromonospora chalcea TaxID=1874 RepID=UPI0033262A59
MALFDVTRRGVFAAMAEFDRLGRDDFLRTYKFGRALSYFVEHDGKLYDSKAIVGYAHGEVFAQRRWTSSDFNGGEATVARHLRDHLGFNVVSQKPLTWTRDELILACDLVWANGWHELRAHHSEVIELSQLLQRYWAEQGVERGPAHRNPNSVSRKTTDLASRHPDYAGKPTRGGRLDRDVLAEFMAKPEEMHRQAHAIRAAILAGEGAHDVAVELADPDLDGFTAQEGGLLERMHLRRERDRGIRDMAVEAFKRKHGFVACEACGFNFAAVYGQRGDDYIECHHRVPLSQSGPTKTRVFDLVLLCSNCHRMIHRTRPWLTFEELVQLLKV